MHPYLALAGFALLAFVSVLAIRYARRATDQHVEELMTPEVNLILSDEITRANLHPDTDLLVRTFASGLAAKLARAQDKYGYSNEWKADNWEEQCRADLLEHIKKGDPMDVAAYCAFMWHHGWATK